MSARVPYIVTVKILVEREIEVSAVTAEEAIEEVSKNEDVHCVIGARLKD